MEDKKDTLCFFVSVPFIVASMSILDGSPSQTFVVGELADTALKEFIECNDSIQSWPTIFAQLIPTSNMAMRFSLFQDARLIYTTEDVKSSHKHL